MSVVIAHGDKGGVGKSTVAGAYAEYVLAQGKSLTVVECDTSNPDFARYMKQANVKVIRVNLRVDAGWIELVNLLAEDTSDEVVISLPATISPEWNANASNLLGALEATGRKGAVLWTLGRTLDSLTQLKKMIDAYGSGLPVVAVRNTYWSGGDPALFKRWEESKLRGQVTEAGGGDISLPALTDGAYDITFGSVPPVRFTGKVPTLGHQMFLNTWVKKTFAEFDKVASILGTGSR